VTWIADYELVDVIGRGDHGVSHRARPPQRLGLGDEFVVVKVLEHNATDADFARLATELQVLSSVQSPHLATLYEVGEQDGRLFYAMRFYPQQSLAQNTGLDASTVIRVVADAARGAHALHEVGVVHRDIKPANIMFEAGRGYLADLGLAQVWAPGMTTTGGGPIGSVEYMEPDVIYGERAMRTSDIWSLAITLHVALTGAGCHGEIPQGSVLGAFRHVLHTEPIISDDLPPAVRAVLVRALAPQRAQRHPSALAFAEELEQAGGLI
jgi:eukaryotic-like serine/threonine-protein kinase